MKILRLFHIYKEISEMETSHNKNLCTLLAQLIKNLQCILAVSTDTPDFYSELFVMTL
jgi:hypothetical protein